MKGWSKSICFIIILLVPACIRAQDIIIKTNNDTVFCKILDVNDKNIRYQIYDGNIKSTNILNLRYITDYHIGENSQVSEESITVDEKKEPVFRIAVTGGYAHKIGEILRTNDAMIDQLTKDLVNGYSAGADIEYYFNWKGKDPLNFGIALNLNYIDHRVRRRIGGDFPLTSGYGEYIMFYKESQTVFYAGPAFVMRYDLPQWLFTMSVGLGAVFYTDYVNSSLYSLGAATTQYRLNAATTVVGSAIGIGADYKISPNWGIGLKLSVARGSYNSLTAGNTTVDFDQRMSAASWMISGVLSFRTK